MKISTKILAVAFVVAIALTVTTVGAAGYEFSNSLTIGSTGADVVALQTALVANGSLTMPAGVSMGYFGALTQSAVAKFQVANGITPAAGYFGPITRAAFNNAVGAGTQATGALCPNGMTLASNCSAAPASAGTVALCPNGMTIASNCAAAPGTVSMNGTDGTLNAGVSSYVSSGITVKKGETKDILAENFKASVGPVTITRAAVHFNTRPWLVLSQVTLHDSTGKVLATKALNSAADATEITVGSDYLVQFGDVNYTVNPGANIDLVVGATVLSATDKISGTLALNSAFDGFRTINGIGWTDSIGAGTLGATGAGSNSVTLSSTASTADINVRISPNSPSTRQQTVSATQTTSNVVLGTFSLKSANNASTLNTLKIAIASTTLSTDVLSAFSNVRLMSGSTSYGGVLASTGVVTFSNLTLPLSQDVWQDFSVQADIASDVTGTGVKVTLTAASANIVVIDSNYNTATINGSAGGNSAVSTSNLITLTVNAVSVTNISAVLGSAIVQTNVTTGYNVTETFTVNNTSNDNLFVSATSTVLAPVTVVGSASTSELAFVQSVTPSSYNGDTTGAGASYVVPAGLSRTFTLVGVIRGAAGETVNMKVSKIRYGLTAAAGTLDDAATTGNAAYSVAFGLENLSLTASF